MARKPERNHVNQSMNTFLFLVDRSKSKRFIDLERTRKPTKRVKPTKNSTWAYHILMRYKQKAMMSSTFQVRESAIFYSWDKEKRPPLWWHYCPKRTKSVLTILLIWMRLFRNKIAFHSVWSPLLSYKREIDVSLYSWCQKWKVKSWEQAPVPNANIWCPVTWPITPDVKVKSAELKLLSYLI